MAAPARKFWGVQFHPEVAHTPRGGEILANFLFRICRLRAELDDGRLRRRGGRRGRARKVGPHGRAVCGLSGGVDSSVAAALVLQGDRRPRLTCIFVDNGLLRAGEAAQVESLFRDAFKADLRVVDASERFLGKLAGVTDPEQKRKIIGREFIAVFEEEAQARSGGAEFLVQGTLYPDVIESVSFKGPSATIKSHHNVGGLPERMHLKLIEPLRELFKDEVRALGAELGLPRHVLWRQPFPGPGLAVRVLGEVTARALRRAARRRRHHRGGDPRRRPLRVDLAVVRRAAAGAHRRRHGRRAHLRRRARAARRALERRHDRRLGAAALRPAGDHLVAHHQRGQGHQPRRLRHLVEAARDDRVGVAAALVCASIALRRAVAVARPPRLAVAPAAPPIARSSRRAAGVTVDWQAGTLAAAGGAAADLRMPSVDLARPGAAAARARGGRRPSCAPRWRRCRSVAGNKLDARPDRPRARPGARRRRAVPVERRRGGPGRGAVRRLAGDAQRARRRRGRGREHAPRRRRPRRGVGKRDLRVGAAVYRVADGKAAKTRAHGTRRQGRAAGARRRRGAAGQARARPGHDLRSQGAAMKRAILPAVLLC